MPDRIKPGSKPISADLLNKLADAKQRLDHAPGLGNSPGQSSNNPTQLSISVSNQAGVDLTADFPILVLGDVGITPDENAGVVRGEFFFDATAPVEETNDDFVVCQAPVVVGEIVNAVVAGFSWVDIDISDEVHDRGVAIDGDSDKLDSSGSGGVPILWKPTGTGIKRCVIQVGGPKGSNRTAGAESSLGILVRDMPKSTFTNLSGKAVADWSYTPGQAGVSAELANRPMGSQFAQHSQRDGVVLVDWERTYDHADLSTYEDAPYTEPKTKFAPIVEKLDENIQGIGGGLGGTGGGGGGLGGGGGGGGGI